jgi:hypothetical protein
MVIALVALVVALEGSALADGSARVARLISGTKIKSNTITSKQIKNRTITKSDLNASVLRGLYTTSQSDQRFVKNVPGTIGQAPNAAALGGKDASAFYDKSDSDLRFVTKAPGTSNQAPDSAALEGHPAREFALKGADVTGSISGGAGVVAAHSCVTLALSVSGARVDDLPVLAFVGSTPVPPGLTFQPLKVSADDSMTLRLCNPTNVPSPAFTDVGVRIIAFR